MSLNIYAIESLNLSSQVRFKAFTKKVLAINVYLDRSYAVGLCFTANQNSTMLISEIKHY